MKSSKVVTNWGLKWIIKNNYFMCNGLTVYQNHIGKQLWTNNINSNSSYLLTHKRYINCVLAVTGVSSNKYIQTTTTIYSKWWITLFAPYILYGLYTPVRVIYGFWNWIINLQDEDILNFSFERVFCCCWNFLVLRHQLNGYKASSQLIKNFSQIDVYCELLKLKDVCNKLRYYKI